MSPTVERTRDQAHRDVPCPEAIAVLRSRGNSQYPSAKSRKASANRLRRVREWRTMLIRRVWRIAGTTRVRRMILQLWSKGSRFGYFQCKDGNSAVLIMNRQLESISQQRLHHPPQVFFGDALILSPRLNREFLLQNPIRKLRFYCRLLVVRQFVGELKVIQQAEVLCIENATAWPGNASRAKRHIGTRLMGG